MTVPWRGGALRWGRRRRWGPQDAWILLTLTRMSAPLISGQSGREGERLREKHPCGQRCPGKLTQAGVTGLPGDPGLPAPGGTGTRACRTQTGRSPARKSQHIGGRQVGPRPPAPAPLHSGVEAAEFAFRPPNGAVPRHARWLEGRHPESPVPLPHAPWPGDWAWHPRGAETSGTSPTLAVREGNRPREAGGGSGLGIHVPEEGPLASCRLTLSLGTGPSWPLLGQSPWRACSWDPAA